MGVIGGVGEGPVSQFVMISKQIAEQAVNEKIQDVVSDPAKRIRELQQPSPFSQFIDIKI
ncbi:hypothetical protein [Bacillus badius]|uniref:Uncharacterized protein n=1 Tax=Bacillus badius TaxID=1455 RepID=A0ABR5AUP9_BACBA|nr:hypothetical protein [Bacillus badius]KIL78434.1 hypothetical protein SD77_4114 [Bacillus badius]MED4716090.1 hypothetical protein [Bacillus badius]